MKFSESWSLLDVDTKTNLPLEKQDIECLNRLFSALLKQDKIVNALQVTNIPPNKLVNLTVPEKNGVPKKQTDLPSK